MSDGGSYYCNSEHVYTNGNGNICCSLYAVYVVVGGIWKWNYNLREIHVIRKSMWNVLDVICALATRNKYCSYNKTD